MIIFIVGTFLWTGRYPLMLVATCFPLVFHISAHAMSFGARDIEVYWGTIIVVLPFGMRISALLTEDLNRRSFGVSERWPEIARTGGKHLAVAWPLLFAMSVVVSATWFSARSSAWFGALPFAER